MQVNWIGVPCSEHTDTAGASLSQIVSGLLEKERKLKKKMCLVLPLHVYNRLVGRHSRCSRESGTQTHNGG